MTGIMLWCMSVNGVWIPGLETSAISQTNARVCTVKVEGGVGQLRRARLMDEKILT